MKERARRNSSKLLSTSLSLLLCELFEVLNSENKTEPAGKTNKRGDALGTRCENSNPRSLDSGARLRARASLQVNPCQIQAYGEKCELSPRTCGNCDQ
ncbi:hypothetical protein B0H11DRAFT_1949230 [Mycena galericulata]|nr:hypothetical protein B0H11DRAFT_1949230 [Mycena galericulata]